MSGKGEILELARMAKPQIRVVLNVGSSHLESLTSLEEVAMAKGENFWDAKSGDVCILNGDDPLVTSLPVPHGVRTVAENTDGGLGVRVVLEKGKEMVDFVIPSPGLHLSLDACAAATVATLFGVSLAQVGISLSVRSELQVARNGIRIVNDSYNANPISTRAAIDLLKSIACDGIRVAVLGDMLELGSSEIEFHEQILSYCCDCRIGLVGLAGKRQWICIFHHKNYDDNSFETSLGKRLSAWFMEKGTGREAKFVIVLKLLMDSYQEAKQELLETRTSGKMVKVISDADASKAAVELLRHRWP
ncbi:hypothetical protein QYF36_006439 [Acer negundo]|nr:hypothetical protein QYF36_006439 [Acer negundo]